jgi:hypothetical protein
MVVQVINYVYNVFTSIGMSDFWAAWSKDFQNNHLARMSTFAFLVFMLSGTTKRPWVGKFYAGVITMGLSAIWHSLQEPSYYAFAKAGFITPPWIGNYAPQSWGFELLGDLMAVVWAVVTSILLDTPCCYEIESVLVPRSEKGKARKEKRKVLEAEEEEEIKEGRKAKGKGGEDVEEEGEGEEKAPMLPARADQKTFMRSGGAILIFCFLLPLFLVVLSPLSMVFLTRGAASVTGGVFRLDICLFCLIWCFVAAMYWLLVFFYTHKFGRPAGFSDILANYDKWCGIYTLGAHCLSYLCLFALCVHSFMDGLEFLQPTFGYAAAYIPTFAFCIVRYVLTSNDDNLKLEVAKYNKAHPD